MFTGSFVRSSRPCLFRPIPSKTLQPQFHQRIHRLPTSKPRVLSQWHTPRPLPTSSSSLPRPSRTFSQTPTPHRRRTRYTRFDPEEARRAKPLLTGEQIFNHFFRNPVYKFGAIFIGVGATTFYVWNLEKVPISGRRRFNCVSEDIVAAQGEESYRIILQEFGGHILPAWDPRNRLVNKVMNRLIPVSGLENVSWQVYVIDSPERNAFVIPGGKVFVFSGLLDITKTEDGLAAVLGHEIAHSFARHAAESMSRTIWFTPFLYIVQWSINMALSSSGLGDLVADLIMNLGVMMPASRKQELEADYIGLLMMARGCYDPKAAVEVWKRMEMATKGTDLDIPQILSTHPSNANRIIKMGEWLPKAEAVREDSGCAMSLEYARSFKKAVGNYGLWG